MDALTPSCSMTGDARLRACPSSRRPIPLQRAPIDTASRPTRTAGAGYRGGR